MCMRVYVCIYANGCVYICMHAGINSTSNLYVCIVMYVCSGSYPNPKKVHNDNKQNYGT